MNRTIEPYYYTYTGDELKKFLTDINFQVPDAIHLSHYKTTEGNSSDLAIIEIDTIYSNSNRIKDQKL